MIILLFFLSGATALVYEVVWSKYLALMLGSTVQAQTVVLAVFMGGLALGNRIFGGLSRRVRHPLATYGYIEIVIGVYAFSFGWIYQLADFLFVTVGSHVLERATVLLVLKGVLSVALLLGPTVLMGGTLPLLAEWLQREWPDAGRWSARFYSTNSLGAVCGSGLAGFFLVRLLGMTATLQAAAFANVMIGLAAIGLSRRRKQPSAARLAANSSPEAPGSIASFKWACLLVALTGAVSMGLEVLASRSLALIFGASLQAFAVVLMAFILGIGIGSAVVASPRFKNLRRDATTVVLLLGASALIGIAVLRIEQWVEFYRMIKVGLARNEMGYRLYEIQTALMAMAVLGLPAALLGGVLPLWIRALGDEGAALGERVGRLLTWNTLGAVVGVLVTGFVLMPGLGLRGSFGLLAALLSVTSLVMALANKRFVTTVVAGGWSVFLAFAYLTGGEGWRHVMSSGVFRLREAVVDRDFLRERRQHTQLLFYEDAADATVSVEQGDGVQVPDHVMLRINGKIDASSSGDMGTQFLLGHLPMIAKPDSKKVFLLGFGSGISGGAVLGHPIERLVIAENCEPVLRAGKFFERWNRGVLTNSVARIWKEDARTILKLSPDKYDVILSEPSNPWTVGVGSVFSREFYQLAASRLEEGGLMAQWFHVYEMSDDIIAMVVRTFSATFPYLEIWDTGPGDIIMLGARKPWASGPETYRPVFNRTLPREDLARLGLTTPEMVWARQLASQRGGFAIPGDGVLQSDEFPVLEYEAPKAFYIGGGSRLLFQFDERTWESDLAREDKNAVLSSLGIGSLKSIFGVYSSVNLFLREYLVQCFEAADHPEKPHSYFENLSMPCVFRTFARALPLPPLPASASEAWKFLAQNESLLRTDAARWREGVDGIISVLRAHQPGSDASNRWSPSHYSGLATRISLKRGDLGRAQAVLLLGLQREPASTQLRYLARILNREFGAVSASSTPVPQQ